MIHLNFLWHLHQPDYRHPSAKAAVLPWVRLHAVKGYNDLLTVLEHYEHARCTVNFSGVLLDQLQELCQGGSETYAELTARRAGDLSLQDRRFMVKQFFSANRHTLIKPHSRYYELLRKKESLLRLGTLEAAAERFTVQELTDLAVWFNLAWIGFAGQRRDDVRELIARGREFSHEHQLQILAIHRELMGQIIPRYRALAEAGRIELSFTPFHHPILPLLCDLSGVGFRNESDPLPDFRQPDDAQEQIRRGIAAYERNFQRAPVGAWPAEGSVSDAALGQFANAGMQWVATDQQNLFLKEKNPLGHLAPWRYEREGSTLAVFFRDTRLADNIGFEYARWNPGVASSHLIEMVLGLGRQSGMQEPVVTIALDGENPWEAYPDGGEGFLTRMWARIAVEQDLVCSLPSAIIQAQHLPPTNHISAGSWIGGNFNIWSRHPETRTAWRRLARTRTELVDVMSGAVLDHILAAEGSDWFWWYGDDFESEQAETFDELFRSHLIAAYEQAGRSVPDDLYEPICTERRAEVVRMVTVLIEPAINGLSNSFFEWRGAIKITPEQAQSAMARSSAGTGLLALWYGFSEQAMYLRLDPSPEWSEAWKTQGGKITVNLSQNGTELNRTYEIPAKSPSAGHEFAFKEIAEMRIDLAANQISYGALAYLWVEISTAGGLTERFPPAGRITLQIIPEDFAAKNWTV